MKKNMILAAILATTLTACGTPKVGLARTTIDPMPGVRPLTSVKRTTVVTATSTNITKNRESGVGASQTPHEGTRGQSGCRGGPGQSVSGILPRHLWLLSPTASIRSRRRRNRLLRTGGHRWAMSTTPTLRWIQL